MGKIMYVVCTTAGSPGGERPCAVFSTEEAALKECKRLAEKARLRTEKMWDRVFGAGKQRKLSSFKVVRTKKPRLCPGYGVRRDEKHKRRNIVHDLVYYVEEFGVDKKSMRPWA